MQTVAVGMSGGLDSSVAAHLLKNKTELDIFGFTMRLGEYEAEHERTCCNMENLYRARKLCDRLGINHYTIDMQQEFGKEVIQPFLAAYQSGRTPNPCSICNREIKMDRLLRKVRKLGADRVVTGHYVRRIGRSMPRLDRGVDERKDQSYYLSLVKKENLNRFWFPLGFWRKEEVLEYARRWDLEAVESTESQSLCFAPDRDYRRYILENSSYQPATGDIVNIEGEKIGEHPGHINFTIGQRRGLGISHSQPLYVLEINGRDNELVVGERDKLGRSRLYVDKINWLADKKDDCQVQLRYNSPAVACRIAREKQSWRIELHRPVEAVAPGQVAAFYSDRQLLGGGIITSAPPDYKTESNPRAEIKPRK